MCWIVPMYNSSFLVFHVPRGLIPSCCSSRCGVHPVGQSPLSPTCYLKLACGPAYTGTLAPPLAMGGPRTLLEVLKGPCKSFYYIVLLLLLLSWKRADSPPRWWTSGVATLSFTISSSTWFATSYLSCCWSSSRSQSQNGDSRPSFHTVSFTLMCSSLFSSQHRLRKLSPSLSCSQMAKKNPLECPTRAVRWCGHADDAAYPLASVCHRSWRVTDYILNYIVCSWFSM